MLPGVATVPEHQGKGLAGQIADFGAFETHEAYRARLKVEHGRKASFWSLLD